jgi:hypothetical protein
MIKKKMNVTRSILDDINTKQLKWYGHVQRMEEERLPKQVMKWSPPRRRKRGRPKLTWVEGIRGLMGEKGLVEEDWNDRRMEKEDTVSVQWAQEGVETSYNLLNNNNNNNYYYYYRNRCYHSCYMSGQYLLYIYRFGEIALEEALDLS